MSQEPLNPTLGEVLEKAKFLISKLAGWQGVDLTQLDEDYDGAITAIWNASQEARDDAAELRAAAQRYIDALDRGRHLDVRSARGLDDAFEVAEATTAIRAALAASEGEQE